MSDELDGSFQIKWDGARYTVSIPNYSGGDVIAIEHYRALAKERDALKQLVEEFQQHHIGSVNKKVDL